MVRGDHFLVNVVSNTREHLDAALSIAMTGAAEFTHYCVKPACETDRRGETPPALTLCHVSAASRARLEADGWVRLPFVLKNNNAADFVWGWLESAERGSAMDIDGSEEPDAFEVRANAFDAVTIIPRWSVYSK